MKFKINGISWEILEVSQKEIKTMQNQRNANDNEVLDNVNHRYYGITYCDECKIYLDIDLPLERKKHTLIHELTHCYIQEHITHLEKTYEEEMVCDVVANSFNIIHNIVSKYFKGVFSKEVTNEG